MPVECRRHVSTQPLVHSVIKALSGGLKQLGREADYYLHIEPRLRKRTCLYRDRKVRFLYSFRPIHNAKIKVKK